MKTTFDAIYDEGTSPEIEFGEFKGRKKFEKVLDIPTQDMRDSCSEQQRKLIDRASPRYKPDTQQKHYGFNRSHLVAQLYAPEEREAIIYAMVLVPLAFVIIRSIPFLQILSNR